jgi:gamma-glutamylaminecyclotransferase
MPDAVDEKELVFVYGTLRRGGSNAFRMEGAVFCGEARVEGELHAITWYPGLTLKAGAGWVIGEVYQVGPEQMRALDEFEGLSAGEVEGSEYRRVRVPVLLNGEMVPAWVYEWKGPVEPGKKVVSGDWLEAG